MGSLKLGDVGGAVGPAALAGADGAHERLAVGGELGEAVVAGVGDEQGAAGQLDDLGGEAQGGGDRLGRDVGAVAAVQRAGGLVLGDELLDEDRQVGGVPLPCHGGDDVALGVDDDEGRPGAGGVGRPGDELGVVEDGVGHAVALDRRGERVGVGLVDELRASGRRR